MSSYRRAVSECGPLVDAADKDIYRRNAFRIIGVPVDATAAEIGKRADKLRMMEDLGEGYRFHNSPFAIRPPPTMDQIRDAIARLQSPEKRMVDEFFWFWPEEFGRSRMDPAIQALLSGDCDAASAIWTVRESTGTAATHNIAVFWHFTALEREHYDAMADGAKAQESIAETSWRNAIKRWRYLLADQAVWSALDSRVRQLNDPQLSSDFGKRMRSAMPLALAKIHAQVALNCIERQRPFLARTQVELLRELAAREEIVEMAADLVLDKAKRRLQSHSQNVKDEAARSPERAAELARTLIAPTLLLFEIIDLFFGDADYVGKDLLNETASVCVECAVMYQRKTGDNGTFVDLLERLRPISDNAELTARISENLRIGKKNLEIEVATKEGTSNASTKKMETYYIASKSKPVRRGGVKSWLLKNILGKVQRE